MTQETNKHPTDTELREKVEKAAMMLEERGHTQMSHELLAATAHQDAEIARLREALKRTIHHIEHMGAWINNRNAGYSFESIGEDMPNLRQALASQPSATDGGY